MQTTTPKEARFLGLEDRDAEPGQAQCVVVPAPYERTSSYGRGSANGPAAIIEASHQVEFFDSVLQCEPHTLSNGIATATPLAFEEGEEPAACVQRIQDAVAHWLGQDKFVVTIGGEHMAALGAILAHIEHVEDLTILQFDAHSDLRDAYEGSPYNHACVMRRVYDRHPRIIQVGIRSQCKEERQFQQDKLIPAVYARDIHKNCVTGGNSWIREVIAMTGKNVYVTFDCDVFDPSVIPATGTPEPDGLTWDQVTTFFEMLVRWRHLVGIDFTELAPIEGLHHPQFTIAKLVNRVIGHRFATPTPTHPDERLRPPADFE